MEEVKRMDELTKIDERHLLLGQITGRVPDLQKRHDFVTAIEMHAGVPDEIRSQFNVAKNMALYQYFFYALAPEVQHKTYTIIEYALKLKDAPKPEHGLKRLLSKAVKEGWISDAGFRHIEQPQPDNPYCNWLVDNLPKLRNEAAHGSNMLTPDCLDHLVKCADFVNQLFDGVTA
ncbi:MAG: hypothetical protein RJA63_892 [Pseudomonadota bacterium]|jgi:hypothetical protein|nr:hypothetical protein [Uliginosibacterium sp.]